MRALIYEGHDVVGAVTQPDRPRGRGRRESPSPVKEVALEEGIQVLTPDRPGGDAFRDELRNLHPDISVVVAYGHILSADLLSLPPEGSINLHASLLPELRGAAPVNWAILRGMKVTGVSVMRMVEAMDAGPVILQIPEEIGAAETATELATRLSEVGASALVEALALLEEGIQEETEQDHASATFAPKLNRDMARIDWTRRAEELGWHVRGLDAVPGAWTVLKGDSVKLFRPTPDSEHVHGSAPGTILEASPEVGLVVACGRGSLRLGEVQSAGSRRMPAEDWLRGRLLPPGTSFE